MKLIVGLGNPGKQFENTRHNIGFDSVDLIAEQFDSSLTKQKFNGLYGETIVHGEKVMLLKPLTYMNLSGECVRPFMDYFNVSLEELVVLYDDLDIPPGKIRLRQKGSAGGHNGIKSLIHHLGTQEFNRVRIGVGRPTNNEPVVKYVLNRAAGDEKALLEDAIKKTAQSIEAWITKPFLEVMNVYNR